MHQHSFYTREIQCVWQRWIFAPHHARHRYAGLGLLSLAFHILLVLSLSLITPSQPKEHLSSRLAEGKPTSQVARLHFPSLKPLDRPPAAAKDSAPGRPKPTKNPPPKAKALAKAPYKTFPQPHGIPLQPNRSPESPDRQPLAPTPVPQGIPSPFFPKSLQQLLPNGDPSLLAKHQQYGHASSLGDDLVAESLEDLHTASTQTSSDGTGDVIVREFSLAAYYDSLDRLFSDAWGSYRVLPPDSKFYGVVGEYIEYLFVVNRDGSLKGIVNVSSQKQPHRDFSAVDHLVNGVIKHLFPINPVPERIGQDPLVLRKKIRFVGYNFGIF